MKTLEKYKCEICGKVYDNKRECEACETGHKKPTKIIDRKYEDIGVRTVGFPYQITVETQDGKKAIYRFRANLLTY